MYYTWGGATDKPGISEILYLYDLFNDRLQNTYSETNRNINVGMYHANSHVCKHGAMH